MQKKHLRNIINILKKVHIKYVVRYEEYKSLIEESLENSKKHSLIENIPK